MTELHYPIIVEPLSEADGGGFVAFAPDLRGCMSDGESPEAALSNIIDAITVCIEATRDMGHDIPSPTKHLETV